MFASAQDTGRAEPETVFHSDVQLVRILATVKDRAGALVGSLEKTDFTVRDNGVPQQISVFERQTDQPLSVALLIDNSGSTAKDLKYETDSLTRFLRAILREGNPEDAVSLYSFNWEIVKLNGFTRNIQPVERSLRALRGEAGTALYDAILLAARDIEDRPGRKILVIVTDGGDTVSHSDFARATEAAQLADAVIYPVLVIPIRNDAGRNSGGENALTTLAQRTGGRVFEPSLGPALDQAFEQILRDLRTQYLIGFYPHNVPSTKERFHTLDVGVSNVDFSVTARNGYYGETQQQPSAPARVEAGAPGSDSIRAPRKKPVVQPDKRRNAQN
ncbi:MAG TPA: VWA domain-containing protein [Bryobacteraceae bacterium]|nr:VWA domain-containing protein [Bryobacteraceae bacterium]